MTLDTDSPELAHSDQNSAIEASVLSRQPANWIGLSSILRPRQHSVDYMGDGFYRSEDPTNSIKVLKVHIVHRQIKHTIIKQ